MKNLRIMLLSLTLLFPIPCLSSISQPPPNPKIIANPSSPAQHLKTFLLQHGYESVPLQLSKDKNFLLLSISINNQPIPNPFILDTGATRSSLDQQMQSHYQFPRHGKMLTTGGAGGHYFRTYQVIIPQLTIGTINIDHQLMIIQSYSHIKADNQPIAGMIGLDLLRNHQAILDVQHNRIFLKMANNKSKLTEAMLKHALQKMHYKLIPLQRSPSGHQLISVNINHAKPELFMLDTGVAAPIMLDDNYARSIGVKIVGTPTIGKGSSNAAMKIFHTTVDKLRIDSIVSYHQLTLITTGLTFAKIGRPVLGVIGLHWLQANHALIDVSNDLLFYHDAE